MLTSTHHIQVLRVTTVQLPLGEQSLLTFILVSSTNNFSSKLQIFDAYLRSEALFWFFKGLDQVGSCCIFRGIIESQNLRAFLNAVCYCWFRHDKHFLRAAMTISFALLSLRSWSLQLGWALLPQTHLADRLTVELMLLAQHSWRQQVVRLWFISHQLGCLAFAIYPNLVEHAHFLSSAHLCIGLDLLLRQSLGLIRHRFRTNNWWEHLVGGGISFLEVCCLFARRDCFTFLVALVNDVQSIDTWVKIDSPLSNFLLKFGRLWVDFINTGHIHFWATNWCE